MANELTTTNNTAVTIDDVPDYLKGESSGNGLSGLDSKDFILPRIKLLQSLSPEVKTFQGVAIPGNFWHTSANENLGDSVKIVVCAAHKRVILWSARSGANSEMLAFSADGNTWAMGGNMLHEITIDPKSKRKVKVHTKSNVLSSGLLNWGSSDPDDPKSGPAATLIYEYLCYMPERPDISPVMFGMYRTGTVNAKSLNTQLLMVRQQGKPITAAAITTFATEEKNEFGQWYVPNFKRSGWVVEKAYKEATRIQTEYEKHTADYSADAAPTNIKDDEISF